MAGLFGVPVLPRKRATQQLQGFVGIGTKMAHLRSDIGDVEPIHQGEHATIEGGWLSLSCLSVPRKVLPSIATWAIAVTSCSASQWANASLYVELVGKRLGHCNCTRSQLCRSLIQSTMPLTVVSPANFPSISSVNNKGMG